MENVLYVVLVAVVGGAPIKSTELFYISLVYGDFLLGCFYGSFPSDEVETPEHHVHVVYAVVILVNPCSHMMHVSSLAVTVCYTWGLMLARNVFIW